MIFMYTYVYVHINRLAFSSHYYTKTGGGEMDLSLSVLGITLSEWDHMHTELSAQKTWKYGAATV